MMEGESQCIQEHPLTLQDPCSKGNVGLIGSGWDNCKFLQMRTYSYNRCKMKKAQNKTKREQNQA